MAANKDVTVIIFDVGQNTLGKTSKNGSSFFEREKECVQKILLRKLFSKPKDEVSMILMGTDGTDNELHGDHGGYEHISYGFTNGVITWNMLKYVEGSIEPTKKNVTADWLDAIVVAMDNLNKLAPVKAKLKIILLTTFFTAISSDQVEQVLEGLNQMEIELIVISSDIEYTTDENEDRAGFSQSTPKNTLRRKNERLILRIIDETSGILCSFDEAVQQLIFYEKQQKRRVPWNCDLEIGTNIQIKIAAYIFVQEDKELGSWKNRGTNGATVKLVKHFFHNNQLIEVEDLMELLKGYKFGQKPIPYDQAEGFAYDSGGKSFKCVGFVNQSSIFDEHLCGTGIKAVVAAKDCPVAERALAALTTAMRELNLAMIVRQVYAARTKPKMMALFPNNLLKNSPKHNSFVMHELIYKDNLAKIPLPSIKTPRNEPSTEQYEAIEKLIDSMDLMTAGSNEGDEDDPETGGSREAFKRFLNPVLQHTYRTIAHRALHPSEPVLTADKDLMDLLNAPPKIRTQSKPHVEKVKELFKLEPVVRSSKQELFAKMQKISAGADVDANTDTSTTDRATDLIEVGTVTPDEDFAELLQRGERFDTLAVQIQNVISNFVLKSVALPVEKVLRAVMIYREEAKLLAPYRYNEWIGEFKATLLQRRKLDTWEKIIVAEKFGLITDTESERSTVTEEEAAEFYKIDSANSGRGGNGAADEEPDDVNDLFDDM